MYMKANQVYQNNQVTTATPGELTLMLYNGGIKFLKQAKAAIQENKMDVANENNIKVQNIIKELIITLDHKYPMSEQFQLLYDYMLRRTVEANMKKEVAILDEVEDFFVQFRDTWKEAMILAKKQA